MKIDKTLDTSSIYQIDKYSIERLPFPVDFLDISFDTTYHRPITRSYLYDKHINRMMQNIPMHIELFFLQIIGRSRRFYINSTYGRKLRWSDFVGPHQIIFHLPDGKGYHNITRFQIYIAYHPTLQGMIMYFSAISDKDYSYKNPQYILNDTIENPQKIMIMTCHSDNIFYVNKKLLYLSEKGYKNGLLLT
jgi:hypothetical protein